MESNATTELSMDWLAFMNNLRAASRVLRAKVGDEALLSYDGACLHVEFAGGGFTVPARGNWPGQVRIPATWLMVLVKMPPKRDPIVFCREDGRLHLESSSVSCVEQSNWRAAIQVPVNASSPMLVALSLRYEDEEIAASGLTAQVKDAHDQFKRKLRSAAKALEPYGVTEKVLRPWVENIVENNADLNRL